MKTPTLMTIVILLFGLSAFSKDYKVKISLINDTKDTITVYIKQSDQISADPALLFRVKMKIDEQKDTTVSVKQYSIISAYAVLKKGGKTDVKTMLVNDKNLKFSPELTLPKDLETDNKPSLTDFTTSSKLLEYDPTLFMNKTISPQPIYELFNQYLGGLVICVNKNGKDSIIDRIEPRELGTEIKPYFNSVEDKKELYFTNQTDQNVKAGIPGIVQLNIQFSISKLYHITIVYKGVGVIGWKNDNDVDINKNYVEKLSLPTHYKIAKNKIKYGDNLRVYQINKAYCFEGIYYQVSDMKKIAENQTINASVYFFNEGNYINENKSTFERTLGSEYVGFWSDIPIMFTELVDFSMSAYYNQQKNLFLSLPETEVIKQYRDMVKSDSVNPNLTKNDIINYLDDYVLAYKTSNPNLSQNSLLKTNQIVVSDELNTLTSSEIDSKYEDINKKSDFTLPKTVSKATKKKYLQLMKEKK